MQKLFRILATAAPWLAAQAQDVRSDQFDARFQATYVWQTKPAFNAPYTGPNSLASRHEKSYTFSTTAFLATRLWPGAELYFNPELVQGIPLSHLTGLGGPTNGEIQKTAGPNLKLYRARLFARQTWGLGGEREEVEAGANQLAGTVDRRRLVMTVGNLAVIDVFDDNKFAHDPRVHFLNWALMTHGAYDYAADARGYSWGAALEYLDGDWAIRAGRFLQPRESNGLRLDYSVARHYGDQVELERAYRLGNQDGRVRLLAFRNVAVMGAFDDALDAAGPGVVPDVGEVRRRRTKRGAGINVEHNLTPLIGAFGRVARADGKAETYAFTEIEQSFSAGLVLAGALWKRGNDSIGLAFARNALGDSHKRYLEAGGLGFFIGDGRLANYRPERLFEAYYSLNVARGSWVAFDLQRIANPAYNADRGPVSVWSIRLHAEF